MAYRIPTDAAAAVGKSASRQVRPCPATRPFALQSHPIAADTTLTAAKRCAASILLSAGLLCGQLPVPEPAMATVDVVAQASSTTSTTSRSGQLPPLALALAPPPLPATSAAAAAAGAAAVVEEAEELVLDVVHFFQHSVEAVESTVHHLQVIHALERLEDMPLNQVVDLQQLKAAMHPVARTAEDVSGSGSGEEGQLEQQPTASAAAAAAAAARLDSALDSVAGMRLREVVDVAKLADALQDVQYSGQLDSRALQREAIRLRRTVHWEAVAEAVRPTELRRALSALGSTHGGSPFSDMDIRAALAAVRMDAVRQVLSPPKPEQHHSHSLESSGMWTWESM